jgi:hypothetical protein
MGDSGPKVEYQTFLASKTESISIELMRLVILTKLFLFNYGLLNDAFNC